MKKLKLILILFFVLFTTTKTIGQILTYTFIDPCTKNVTYFSIPQNGSGTIILFLGKQKYFTANDIVSGEFAKWVNQSYTDYRKISPCGVKQGQVTQNQITSQIIGNTIQSVVGSIMSQAKSESNSSTDGGLVSNNNNSGDNKNVKNNTNTTSNSNNNGSNNPNSETQTNSQNPTPPNTKNDNSGSSTPQGNNQGGQSNGQSNNQNNIKTQNESTQSSTKNEGGEVVGTTTMTVDTKNDRGSDNSNGKGGKNGKNSGRTNPIIVSSDLTSAQNLDRSYTGIINVGMSQSSMTGTSSWGVNSMVWFNFKQFALTGRYTKIQYSKNNKIKLIHNVNLTGVYSYGNLLGFLGYSTILNAGKFGITGVNFSGAVTKTPEDKNLFISPSATAFYTKPFKVGKRIILSPELYVISTPLIYSSVDKVSVSDRTFSMFVGTGFDYQISRRFKLNMNYKLNTSTNPDFPILSFFLIGSKINL